MVVHLAGVVVVVVVVIVRSIDIQLLYVRDFSLRPSANHRPIGSTRGQAAKSLG